MRGPTNQPSIVPIDVPQGLSKSFYTSVSEPCSRLAFYQVTFWIAISGWPYLAALYGSL
jgi:hypothetical protein